MQPAVVYLRSERGARWPLSRLKSLVSALASEGFRVVQLFRQREAFKLDDMFGEVPPAYRGLQVLIVFVGVAAECEPIGWQERIMNEVELQTFTSATTASFPTAIEVHLICSTWEI